MPSFVACAAAICAAISGWLVRGALALQSAAPDAPKVGVLPPWWELGLFLLAAACSVFLLKPSSDRMLPLFATALCALPWLPGVRSAPLLMWTGPLGLLLWWGAVAATVVADEEFRAKLARIRRPLLTEPQYGPILAAAAAFVFFGAVAIGARNSVPAGDEPHYLIITQSLLSDGDLQIENNHRRRDYESYYQGTLEPHFWRRGQNGAIYSIHSPGIPVLIAPAFLIGGYHAVVVFLLAVSAAAAGLLWWLAYAVSGRAAAAWFGLAATVTVTSTAFHAFTVFPDGPAGLLVLTGLWALLRVAGVSPLIPIGSTRTWAWHGAALALLPWMHARFAVLAAAVAVVVLLRMRRERGGIARAVAFLAVPAMSALGWFAFFYVIYGTPSPMAPWTEFAASWSFVPGGVAGILFDQQFGAVAYAPVLLVAAAGWMLLFRGNRRLAIEVAVIAVPYMIVTTRAWIWWAGWSAPARFWTPLFWMAGIPAAVAWKGSTTRATRGTALVLLAVSAVTTLCLAYVSGGSLAYNLRDGYGRWFDWLSPIVELPLGFPSFFRSVDRLRVFGAQVSIFAALFASAFLVVRGAERRLPARGAFALVLLLAYAVATTIGVGIVLRLNGATGVRASVAQLRMLEAARDGRRIGVAYRGAFPRVSNAAEMLHELRIESPPRLASAPGAAPLVLPGWFPAGTYNVFARVPDGRAAEYELRVLRAGTPILRGTTPGPTQQVELTVNLPVDVPALILRGRGLDSAYLLPAHVSARREGFASERARSARRYGAAVVWFVDDSAFDDPDGAWIAGRAEARLVVQPDPGAPLRLVLRNGPIQNDVALSDSEGGWSWSATLAPGQERDITVPVAPVHRAVMLHVRSRGGFRPADVDPSSRDSRLLGVWMSAR